LRQTAATTYRLRTTDPVRALAYCQGQPGIKSLNAVEAGEITFVADEDAVAELSVAMAEAGVGITALIPTRPSLEDLFFRFTEADGTAPQPTPESKTTVMDA